MSTIASPDRQKNWHDGSANTGLVWHPGIRALGWAIHWWVFALCAAITWEFLILHPVNFLTRPKFTVALSGCIFVGLGMLFVIEGIFELWWACIRHVREQYPGAFATANLGITSIFIVVALPLLWFFKWAFHLICQYLHRLANYKPAVTLESAGPPTLEWWLVLLLSAAAIGIGWMLFWGIPATANKYRTALQYLGIRRVLKSMLYMTLVRLRQPRRDFFRQTPLISDMRWWAFCAVLHVWLTGTVFAWILPVPLLMMSFVFSFSYIAPPIWLYLGASEFDSFRIFHTLRNEWSGFYGVTLLNRESEAGLAAYNAEAEHWFKQYPITRVFRNPHMSRVWSLRTRPHLWVQTVKELINLVTVVVIDTRTGSEPVNYELGLLAQPQHVKKTWLLTSEDYRAAVFAAIIGEDQEFSFPSDRCVTEEMLYCATFACDGLRLDSAAGPKRL